MVLRVLACILLINRRIIFCKFTKIFAKVKISIVYLHINKHIKNKIMNTENKTFDLIFNDENNSNNKGFAESLDYCRNYIKHNAGTDFSYFEDYKNGTVSIYCNETDETVEVYSCEDGSLLESKINA